MLDFTPDPIAFQIGPIAVGWYGIGYAVGLAAAYLLITRLAKRAGEDPDVVGNGMIVVAVAALIGGRLYHVIDQWALYAGDPVKIFLPPYSGLGVYGGIVTGLLALSWYTRRHHLSFWRWADIVAPALFLMQAIARWGNFFNQELYGSPTTLPWGIPIDCAHRITAYPCSTFPEATTRFHPLFLYESVSGLIGMLVLLWIGYRFRSRLRPGDIAMVFFIWYGAVRFVLETFRGDNWTFFGVPTAQIVSLIFIATAVAVLLRRHRPDAPTDPPPPYPENAIWGAIGTAPTDDWRSRPIDEPWANLPPVDSDDEPGDDEVDDGEDVGAADAALAASASDAPDAPDVPAAPDAPSTPDASDTPPTTDGPGARPGG